MGSLVEQLHSKLRLDIMNILWDEILNKHTLTLSSSLFSYLWNDSLYSDLSSQISFRLTDIL